MSCVQSFYGALKIFHGPFISIVQILFFSTWHTGKNPLIDNIKKNSRIVAYLKRIFKIEIYATRQGPKLIQTKERVSASFSSVFKGEINWTYPMCMGVFTWGHFYLHCLPKDRRTYHGEPRRSLFVTSTRSSIYPVSTGHSQSKGFNSTDRLIIPIAYFKDLVIKNRLTIFPGQGL